VTRASLKGRWTRDGTTWNSTVFPGWRITDTGQRGKRDRYVIVHPDGTEDRDWHRAHMHKKYLSLNDAQWSAEARARANYHV
jgi:hypothetical protein